MISRFYVQNPKFDSMRKFLITMTAIACSWFGWWVGDHIGLMTAFLLSVVGTGLGVYFGRRFIQF